jgi:hypothetical protein
VSGKNVTSKEVGKIEIKMLLFPNEDDVEELDGANDGESVGEAQHAANVGDEGGHAVRLHIILFNRGSLLNFFTYCINTASSSTPQIPLCRRMLGLNPGLLRLRPWPSDALTIRLDLIHSYTRLDLIHSRLELMILFTINSQSHKRVIRRTVA